MKELTANLVEPQSKVIKALGLRKFDSFCTGAKAEMSLFIAQHRDNTKAVVESNSLSLVSQ